MSEWNSTFERTIREIASSLSGSPDGYSVCNGGVVDIVDRALAEVECLRGALRKYGRHVTLTCPAGVTRANEPAPDGPCTCGLDSALTGDRGTGHPTSEEDERAVEAFLASRPKPERRPMPVSPDVVEALEAALRIGHMAQNLMMPASEQNKFLALVRAALAKLRQTEGGEP